MDLDTLIIFDASGLFSLLRWLTWTHLPFLFFSGAQRVVVLIPMLKAVVSSVKCTVCDDTDITARVFAFALVFLSFYYFCFGPSDLGHGMARPGFIIHCSPAVIHT